MSRLPILVALFALASAASAQSPADSTTVFRHANFGPDWRVTLGQPVAVPQAYLDGGMVERVEPGVHQLGFYESFDYGPVLVVVTVRSDYDGLVTSMRFDYGPEYDFDHERAGYAEMLGPPARKEVSDDRLMIVWEDGETRFVLVREATPGGHRSYSEMSDVAGQRL